MVNVPKFHSLDIIFINVSYPYFLSSYFFLIYTYFNLFKIEMHNKLLLSFTCDLPTCKYACHYMIINCIFPTKSAERWNLMKNANILLTITNLVSVLTSDY